jgi:hypothetical protein
MTKIPECGGYDLLSLLFAILLALPATEIWPFHFLIGSSQAAASPAVSATLHHFLQAAPAVAVLAAIPHHAYPFSLRLGGRISSTTTVIITISLRPSSPKTTMNVGHSRNVAEPEQVQQLGTQIEGEEIEHPGPTSVAPTCWSIVKVVIRKMHCKRLFMPGLHPY